MKYCKGSEHNIQPIHLTQKSFLIKLIMQVEHDCLGECVVKSCYRKRQIKFFGQAWHEEASWESQIENVVVS